jgi:hypothetical protein
LQVNDENAVAFSENKALHLRVPAFGFVTEVNACLEQLLHAQVRHGLSFRAVWPLKALFFLGFGRSGGVAFGDAFCPEAGLNAMRVACSANPKECTRKTRVAPGVGQERMS